MEDSFLEDFPGWDVDLGEGIEEDDPSDRELDELDF
jgi:hypothetical protein